MEPAGPLIKTNKKGLHQSALRLSYQQAETHVKERVGVPALGKDPADHDRVAVIGDVIRWRGPGSLLSKWEPARTNYAIHASPASAIL